MGTNANRAVAVIGTAYGDEGKGLLTDHFAATFGPDTTVVRFNGGAQAGHTVVTPDGRRHVFHHVGSGSLAGAETFLSEHFVANPILFHGEVEALARLGVRPRIGIDPRAIITLPHDMMINHIVERARGNARHGSCGFGFGEAIERSLRPEFVLRAGEYVTSQQLRALLVRVGESWVPERLARLGVARLDEEDRALLASPEIAARWIEDALAFREHVEVMLPAPTRAPIVFEGAQGLLLDQDRGAFPHVTRSNTGLRNVLPLARAFAVTHLDIVYATRAYTTRHGAGPLAHELPGPPSPGVVDETNVTNAWQGALRFAHLDVSLLARSILDDLSDLGTQPFSAAHVLAVTCLDQMGGEVHFRHEGRLQSAAPRELAELAARECGAIALIESFGPTRDAVVPRAPAGEQAHRPRNLRNAIATA